MFVALLWKISYFFLCFVSSSSGLLCHSMSHIVIPNITSRECTCHSAPSKNLSGFNKGSFHLSLHLYVFLQVTEINTNTLTKIWIMHYCANRSSLWCPAPRTWSTSINLDTNLRISLKFLEECEGVSFLVEKNNQSLIFEPVDAGIMKPQHQWCEKFEERKVPSEIWLREQRESGLAAKQLKVKWKQDQIP